MNSTKEKKADIVLRNGQLINVFSGKIYPADVAIKKDMVVEVGDFSGKEEIDLNGRYIVPGFIDSYIHIESTLLSAGELARAVVPHGTTTIVSDPYGIMTVLGIPGIKYLLAASANLPLDIFFSISKNFPSTELETYGAKLRAEAITPLFKNERILKQERLNHIPVTIEEAQERLKDGMQVFVREGSSAKNLQAILPLIDAENSRFFSFCTDDILPVDLALGHINKVIQKAVALKLDPVIAVQMATINPARYFNLKGYGAVAPGYFADINVVSNLEDFAVDMVFKRGKLVAQRCKANFEVKLKKNKDVRETIHVKPFEIESLQIEAKSDYAKAIELVPDQILTKSIVVPIKKKDNKVVADPGSDILKLVVVERHKATGNIGLGLVKGFGLKKGALATSVAHESHNIICVGVDDEDIISAIRRVARLEGGMVAVRGGLVLAELALPIAGLISDQPLKDVISRQEALAKATSDLDCRAQHPFATLSFLELPTIPELRLTDMGLVDVAKSKIVGLFE